MMTNAGLPLQYSQSRLEKVLNKHWYYSVEYSPGQFTKGQNHLNVGLTRELLRSCEVKNRTVLDMGTMEGIIPTLLCRRGAKKVESIDILDSSEHINFVKSVYGVDFNYFTGLQSDLILDYFRRRSASVHPALGEWYEPPQKGFDMVISSGILYHVFSPFHILGTARSLLKKEGLAVIETAVIDDDRLLLQHNFAGPEYRKATGTAYYYGWSDIWFISVPMLDYMLRFFKLQPIDCVYFPQIVVGSHKILRMAVVCRASSDFISFEDETLMAQSSHNMDYGALVDEDFLRSVKSEPVVYTPASSRNLKMRPDGKTVHLLDTVRNTPQLELSVENVRLHLNDLF